MNPDEWGGIMKVWNKNGSTLVECIAAFAIFTLASFILLSGFLTAANLVVKSGEVKINSNNIIDGLETGNLPSGVTEETTSSQSISFQLGGTSYTANGKFKTVTSGTLKLTEFIPETKNTSLDTIPGTGMSINGKWPVYDDYPDQWNYVTVSKGTTFIYNGKYYIAAGDVVVGPRVAPLKSDYMYNTGIIEITPRVAIVWTGTTQTEFMAAAGGWINKGDKVLWNGNYYVFSISSTNQAAPPSEGSANWAKITE